MSKIARKDKKRLVFKRQGARLISKITKKRGYCMKCKKIVSIKGACKLQFRNKLIIIVGNCVVCSTEIYKKRS